MPQKALKLHLDQLRQELAETDTLDDETRQALADIAARIEQLLASSDAEPESIRERLESTALRFEAEHPNLARLLGELSDTLAKLGV